MIDFKNPDGSWKPKYQIFEEAKEIDRKLSTAIEALAEIADIISEDPYEVAMIAENTLKEIDK